MVRFKNRYFLIELEFDDEQSKEYSSSALHGILRDLLATFYGDIGMALVGHSISGSLFIIISTRAQCTDALYIIVCSEIF